MNSAYSLLEQFYAGIAPVLLIFNCSIAIPIPEVQYCIAIQNIKTCSALVLGSGGLWVGDFYLIFLLFYCQTPSPVQNWELTLLSPGNNNKKKNNPHPN